MARRFTDIRRSETYWNFLNQLAEQEEKGGTFDMTLPKVFADFLEENGDPRHIIARAAVAHRPMQDRVFSWRPAQRMVATFEHPEAENTPEKYWDSVHHIPDPTGHPALPLTAFSENANSGVGLYAFHRPNAVAQDKRRLPVLYWKAHIPRTVSTARGSYAGAPRYALDDPRFVKRSRTAHLTAPVTVNQLHDFIDAMPNGATKTRWRQAAHENGWYHPSYAHLMNENLYGAKYRTRTAAQMINEAKRQETENQQYRDAVNPPQKLAREDRAAIGRRIKELIATGLDRRKAVKQAVRECRVKLARAGVSDEPAMLATIKAYPHEDTPWLAYADMLEENDRPVEAARIRWWMGARQYLRGLPKRARLRPTGSAYEALGDLIKRWPAWIARAHAGDFMLHQLPGMPPTFYQAGQAHLEHAFGINGPDTIESIPNPLFEAFNGEHFLGTTYGAARDAKSRIFPDLYVKEPIHAYSNAVDNYSPEWSTRHFEKTDMAAKQAFALTKYMKKNPPPKDEPTKLARLEPHARAGLARATRVSMTDSHQQRLALAHQIMREAGLSPASVRAAVAAANGQTRPSAVIAVKNSVSPEHAAYAAAWYGMLTGEPALTVFQPGEGEHTLHILDSPHPTDHVVNYLSRAGLPPFAVERRGPGSRVYTVSTDPSFDPWQLARGLDARHSRITGQAIRVGGSSDTSSDPGAASRAAYRSRIRATERAAYGDGGTSTGPVS